MESELAYRQRHASKLGWTAEGGFPKENPNVRSVLPTIWYISVSRDDFGSHRTDLPESSICMCADCAGKGLVEEAAPYAYQKYVGSGRCELCGFVAGNPDVPYSNAPYESHVSYGARYGAALYRR